MVFRLFVQNMYVDNPERQAEYDTCFNSNGSIFKESFYLLPFDPHGRLTYQDFFKHVNEQNPTPDDISIIANADIAFNETIFKAKDMKANECYALSRWNLLENGLIELFNRPDSQDVWVFKGPIPEIKGADIPLGIPACDNVIAYVLEQAGYKISNPSKTIVTIHHHLTNVRTYTAADRIPPPYKQIWPHEL